MHFGALQFHTDQASMHSPRSASKWMHDVGRERTAELGIIAGLSKILKNLDSPFSIERATVLHGVEECSQKSTGFIKRSPFGGWTVKLSLQLPSGGMLGSTTGF